MDHLNDDDTAVRKNSRLAITEELRGHVWLRFQLYQWSPGVSRLIDFEKCSCHNSKRRFWRHARSLSRVLLQQPAVQREPARRFDWTAYCWHSTIAITFLAAFDWEVPSLQAVHDVGRDGASRTFLFGRRVLYHSKHSKAPSVGSSDTIKTLCRLFR